ncbi:MAG: TadE family protein [Myxococcota bacterium]
MTGRHRTNPRRRGTQAIEFAMVLPVIMAIIAGVVDFGEYLHRTQTLVHASSDGARAGAKSEDRPLTAARTAAQTAWDTAGGAGAPEFTVTLAGSAPNQRVVVAASMAYEPYFGLVPTPETIDYSCTFRLDHQPED